MALRSASHTLVSDPCILNHVSLLLPTVGAHTLGHTHIGGGPLALHLPTIALITEEGFLISPCYSLELCIQMLISFFSPLHFASLLFTAICKASSDSHFAFLHFFSMGMVLIPVSCIMSQTSIHSSSGTLSDLVP